MSIVLVKADYIYKANLIYDNLNIFASDFSYEAKVIIRAKCILLQESKLNDFYVDGIDVRVYEMADGYELEYMDYVIEMKVDEKLIIDFKVKKK